MTQITELESYECKNCGKYDVILVSMGKFGWIIDIIIVLIPFIGIVYLLLMIKKYCKACGHTASFLG